MTKARAQAAAPEAPLPSPAQALERRFETIWHEQMAGIPMLNPALRVQAVGFRPWEQHWLGVLITPWFMNLMLLPRLRSAWPTVGERESRHYVFPAGVFEFIGGRDAVLGDYQACSLFSPVFEFADPVAAQDTAAASLHALFDPALGPRSEVPPAAPAATPAAATAARHALSKRDFLFGAKPPPDRGA
jgi:[NiFe] hydrogenase assembly HybE family chaperone